MRIWSIILAGTGLTLGVTTPMLASGAVLPVMGLLAMGKSAAGRPAIQPGRDGRVQEIRGDVAWDSPAPPGMRYDDDVTAHDGPPPPPQTAPPHEYQGRWSGTWHDKDGKTYSGEYEGRFEGQVRGGPGVDYDAPPYAAAPHWTSPQPPPASAPGQPLVTTTQAPGYFANGYYYPGVTTTTIVIQPAVKTTRTYVTERVVRRRVRAR